MPDPLRRLATEILIDVLVNLRVAEVAQLGRVSKDWAEFIQENEDFIYKNIAINQLQVHPPCEEPDKFKHDDWKDICKCHIQTQRNRKVQAVGCDWIPVQDAGLWRIKIDENDRLMYSTSCRPMGRSRTGDVIPGGMRVHDLDSKEVLQVLPMPFDTTHIEYGDGFIVQTDLEQIKVFRNQHGQLPPTPNARVLGPMHIPSGQKGDIVALHGILEDTRDYRALRVQGTTLMLAGERRATFWNLVTLECIHTARVRTQARIKYIEFDDEFVFICFDTFEQSYMDVWSRKDTLYCELNASYGVQNPGYFQATTRYIAPPAMMHGKARGFPMVDESGVTRSSTPSNRYRYRSLDWKCSLETGETWDWNDTVSRVEAVHYGKNHLVVACSKGVLLVVPNYKTRIRASRDRLAGKRNRDYYNAQDGEILMLQLQCANDDNLPWDQVNLCVENDLAVVSFANMPSVHSHQTHCSGIDFTSFLATVDLSQIPSIESQRNENGRTEELQHIVFHQLPDMVSGALDESSCVVATSRGIYLPVSMREENAEYSTSIAWYPPHIDVERNCTLVKCLMWSDLDCSKARVLRGKTEPSKAKS